MLPERTEIQEEIKIVSFSLCLKEKGLTPGSTGKGQDLHRPRPWSPVRLSLLVVVLGEAAHSCLREGRAGQKCCSARWKVGAEMKSGRTRCSWLPLAVLGERSKGRTCPQSVFYLPAHSCEGLMWIISLPSAGSMTSKFCCALTVLCK